MLYRLEIYIYKSSVRVQYSMYIAPSNIKKKLSGLWVPIHVASKDFYLFIVLPPMIIRLHVYSNTFGYISNFFIQAFGVRLRGLGRGQLDKEGSQEEIAQRGSLATCQIHIRGSLATCQIQIRGSLATCQIQIRDSLAMCPHRYVAAYSYTCQPRCT
jgi:hypothetical protein